MKSWTVKKFMEGNILEEVMESCFCKKEGCSAWKDYWEGIMNEESDCECNVEVDEVDCPVDCVIGGEVLLVLWKVFQHPSMSIGIEGMLTIH